MGCMVGKTYLTTVEGSAPEELGPAVDLSATEPASRTPPTSTSSTNDQGSSRWFDALTIALGQADGEWYTSTLELQLASFPVCVACRGVRTLRVTVGGRMPLSLWGDDDFLDEQLQGTRRRPLPSLRAAGVSWKIPIGMLVPELSEAPLLRGLQWMKVVGIDCQNVISNLTAIPESCSFDNSQANERLRRSPRRVFEKMLTDIDGGNHQIDAIPIPGSISWPLALRQLSLGCVSNVPINWGALPGSLERLALGGQLDKPIKSIAWPVSLKHLSLVGGFNQAITGVVWPACLLILTFGDEFNQPISGADVVLPPSLLQLTLGGKFNQPITNVVWPPSLPQLCFGDGFDQPIVGVVWPAYLLNLSFGGVFNQLIEDVVWPASLQRLSFGHRFDQPIEDVVWPAALHRLVFGDRFNQPIVGVVWPTTLHSIVFGEDFDWLVEGVAWPSSLWSMGFRDKNGEIWEKAPWPPSLEPVTFQGTHSEDDDTFDLLPRHDSFDHPATMSADLWGWVVRGVSCRNLDIL